MKGFVGAYSWAVGNTVEFTVMCRGLRANQATLLCGIRLLTESRTSGRLDNCWRIPRLLLFDIWSIWSVWREIWPLYDTWLRHNTHTLAAVSTRVTQTPSKGNSLLSPHKCFCLTLTNSKPILRRPTSFYIVSLVLRFAVWRAIIPTQKRLYTPHLAWCRRRKTIKLRAKQRTRGWFLS